MVNEWEKRKKKYRWYFIVSSVTFKQGPVTCNPKVKKFLYMWHCCLVTYLFHMLLSSNQTKAFSELSYFKLTLSWKTAFRKSGFRHWRDVNKKEYFSFSLAHILTEINIYFLRILQLKKLNLKTRIICSKQQN